MQMRMCRCLQKTCLDRMEHLLLCQKSLCGPFTTFSTNGQRTQTNKSQSADDYSFSHWIYMYILYVRVLFIRSVNLHVIFQSKHDSQQALGSNPLSTLWFWNRAWHCLASINKKSYSTRSSFYARKPLRVFAEIRRLVGRWKPPFLLARPLPLISSDSTRRALNRPLSLHSPSSYRQKGGNHDSSVPFSPPFFNLSVFIAAAL